MIFLNEFEIRIDNTYYNEIKPVKLRRKIRVRE